MPAARSRISSRGRVIPAAGWTWQWGSVSTVSWELSGTLTGSPTRKNSQRVHIAGRPSRLVPRWLASQVVACALLVRPPGLVASCLLVVVLFSIPYTSGSAASFFGVSMLLAAWRAQPGCEITVVSNLVLGRDDQVGCCFFGPVDDWEARRSRPSQARAADDGS